jgi:hypothetical protein
MSAAGFVSHTSPQEVHLTQAGPGSVAWTATPNAPWISVSPTAGSGPATLSIGVHFAAGLAATQSGTVTLSFTGAGNTAGTITVGLTTIANDASTAPVGVFDTPQDGTTGVTGSIAVTGWAIDDVEVTRIRIFRDPVAGEGAGQVFIGDGVFIDGARMDIAAAYPGLPRNTRAGWGYMLLTNTLPNQGNGTFKLYAYADDREGHTTLLGSKTITCTNSSATRPFGAIDSPLQGETISGTSFANYGWVLSRGPVRAYPPFGTVTVLIDGVPSGAPGGWVARDDLVGLFPVGSYAGSPNALGVSTIDTTRLSNGLHTIAWVVTAEDGQSEGIGSRFFTVANADAPLVSAATPAPSLMTASLSLTEQIDRAAADTSVIRGRRGYDLSGPVRPLIADANGRATMFGEEMDRFEIQLGATADGVSLVGYLRTPDGVMPLPAGSRLEQSTGTFTWQPGPGFVHGYDFVFVRSAAGRVIARQEVRVEIDPKRSNLVGPQLTIDAPANGATVGPNFMLGGWAVDTDAGSGSGIDAIHVWAYPVGGAAPQFLGAATLNGRRPDVAAVVGEQFLDSGYGLIVNGLAPGTYDLAVFAWSSAAGNWAPAKVVRVTVR